MDRKHSKIAIIGGGFVGASTAYSIATKGIASEIVIIDANTEKADGEAMDISQAMSMLCEMNIYSGGYSCIKDSDVIIVTAGAGRKPGETRLDLAKKNVSISKDIAKNIKENYNSGVIVVVSNPVDIITYTIQKETGIPENMVFGTGAALDTARLRYMLSEKLGVDVKSTHAYIAGEHGDSQFPVWSSAHVAGMSLDKYCEIKDIVIDKEKMENDVKTAGAEVIKRKGATYFAIASVATNIAEAIIKNYKTIFTVSTLMHGSYGVSDMYISLPCVVGRNGIEDVIEFDFTAEELKRFQDSSKEIRNILDTI